MIIDQFFQIIINFPMSQAAVDDLKFCLSKINLKRCFVTTIRDMLQDRLLHPGVDTPDILTGYVAALKTLAYFDTSAVLLRSITKPIKDYLRGRTDTVRCVVTSFTGDGTSDLAEELAKNENVKPKATESDKIDSDDWKNWQPDPVNIAPAALKYLTLNKQADIISMVVDIYGSKEIFVNEYRNLLAERLLSQVEFNPEKEVKHLELLKSRFGESLLHSCDVMLKDISDSKRINAHIHSPDSGFNEELPFQVSALIVSSQFWPTFKKETMELPVCIKDMFEKYTKAYESYKVNRTLQWTPLNGKVTIDVEHNGKVQEMQVTPAQAAIAIHFSEQPQWELDCLGQKMNMPPIVLRKRLVFWQSQGFIRETRENLFVLIDKSSGNDKLSNQIQVQSNEGCEEEEAESAMESASDQREEELQVFWSYIEAMLTNLDSLPLDRIHQMLKMFASQVDFTQDELKHILQRKVREHKLVYAGGVYQLPKFVLNFVFLCLIMSKKKGKASAATKDVELNFDKLSLNEKKIPTNDATRAHECAAELPSVPPDQLTPWLALDCEMVGVGPIGRDHMLARVSIVNEHGNVLVDCYVKPQQIVKDYRTEISGILPEHIAGGVDFKAIREVVRKLISGRILVGHALRNDLMVLNLRHPKYNIRDTARYRPIAKKARSFGTPSLKSIAYAFLGEDIQDGSHDSVEDARAAMKIYLLFQKEWETSSQTVRKV
ncbi:anaphase-promoting complex subunit 2-like [Anopheles nili]|uniref:anaphase-promoting complex subunit 2-like n=1 Tax=Anopheles nili TaxID=185578 RepID=UPI00237ACB6D|nr:anaphase-promoting complex subunit 2-like [Anopheles nili]